jgi:predicted nuclease of predicted toxin-antitoxin system
MMRLLADSNIVAPAVSALRFDGHDVEYAGERSSDPGDAALLEEAAHGGRVFVTKDHDIGALVFQHGARHSGVLLIDDFGSSARETDLLRQALRTAGNELSGGAFVRAGARGVKIVDS